MILTGLRIAVRLLGTSNRRNDGASIGRLRTPGKGLVVIKLGVLDKAITAHACWKARLRSAAGSGKFDSMTTAVKSDDHCELGKWLYSADLSAADKQTEHYRAVQHLHAKFHLEAAKVVALALSGQKDAAAEAIEPGGQYAKVSSALTDAMLKWRDSLR